MDFFQKSFGHPETVRTTYENMSISWFNYILYRRYSLLMAYSIKDRERNQFPVAGNHKGNGQ